MTPPNYGKIRQAKGEEGANGGGGSVVKGKKKTNRGIKQ